MDTTYSCICDGCNHTSHFQNIVCSSTWHAAYHASEFKIMDVVWCCIWNFCNNVSIIPQLHKQFQTMATVYTCQSMYATNCRFWEVFFQTWTLYTGAMYIKPFTFRPVIACSRMSDFSNRTGSFKNKNITGCQISNFLKFTCCSRHWASSPNYMSNHKLLLDNEKPFHMI